MICPTCKRWNLSPLEERWEVFDPCERAFDESRIKAETENIAIARLRDGTHLIRVGRAPRSEIAVWRFGSQFAKRWRRSAAIAVGTLGTSAAIMLTGSYAALSAIPGGALLYQAPLWLRSLRQRYRAVARLEQPNGSVEVIRGKHVGSARLLHRGGDQWSLRIDHAQGRQELQGSEAVPLLGPLLAYINAEGARTWTVQQSVRRLEALGSPSSAFGAVAAESDLAPRHGWSRRKTLRETPIVDRIALEIAASEIIETAALEGELAALERSWREAEEIAAIADDLLIPSKIWETLRRSE